MAGAAKVRALQGELRLAPLAPAAQGLRRGLGFGVVQPISPLQEIDGPARGAECVIVDARTHRRQSSVRRAEAFFAGLHQHLIHHFEALALPERLQAHRLKFCK